ncbi:MAG: sialate O-acetylesterase [Tepidisphaeraceae bacterium]
MRRISILALLTVLAVTLSAGADVKPAAFFSDHMVIQQATPVPVWGVADPGEQITVSLGDSKATATAGADGHWMARLPEQTAGDAPLEMTIAGKNSLTIHDVLVGEVWVGSGQSNMVFPVSKSHGSYAGLLNEEQEIAAANYPHIRMFTPRSVKAYEPQTSVQGQWEVCSPQTVPAWSAVGYLFARNLQKELKVPVGVVTLAFGASTAEAWVSREKLASDPLLKPMLDGFDASEKFYRANPQAPAAQAPPRPWPMNKTGARPTRQTDPVQDQHEPTVLFNAMINPAIPYAMRGVIWYQGESICGGQAGVDLYPHVQAALIQDWRARWGEGDFPFFIVQLPGQKNLSNNPLVREGQAAVLSLPNTEMAVTIDIGEANNVHPHNKEPLGDRLTRIALAKTYGRDIEYSGPRYESMTIEGSAVRIKFSHLGGGLVAKGGALKWFQIAGADQKFVDADAQIDGDTIRVTAASVPSPQAVRYAWDDFPDGCNLYNAADLPAAPFRTDHWDYPLVGIVN